jgi:hypothetical protein
MHVTIKLCWGDGGGGAVTFSSWTSTTCSIPSQLNRSGTTGPSCAYTPVASDAYARRQCCCCWTTTMAWSLSQQHLPLQGPNPDPRIASPTNRVINPTIQFWLHLTNLCKSPPQLSSWLGHMHNSTFPCNPYIASPITGSRPKHPQLAAFD